MSRAKFHYILQDMYTSQSLRQQSPITKQRVHQICLAFIKYILRPEQLPVPKMIKSHPNQAINDKVPSKSGYQSVPVPNNMYTLFPFPTRIKSHYKSDRLSSVPRQSNHFILQDMYTLLSLQTLSPITKQTGYQVCHSQAVIIYSTTYTPSFPYKDKVPLQNRRAIKCANLYSKTCTPSFP